MKFQAPRGTNDIIPGPFQKEPIFETHRWQYVEGEFLGTAWLYGYQEIRTPMFEEVELFIRSSGEASDIVSKEMYDFHDKGQRHVALKPEGTAPVMRAFLEHGLGNSGGPVRLCYINHSFRYGRPGKGRYRQLHQLGLEIVGSDSPLADAEIITASHDFFSRIGLGSVRVMLNCIGDFEARLNYGKIILDHVAPLLEGMDPAQAERLRKNPVRLLDTKDEALKSALQGLPPITDSVGAESREKFLAVQSELQSAGVPFAVDPGIVRGLDYYNDTVFEFVDDALPGLSLCGGGRYDSLLSQIGGKPTPSAGVGIGLERLLLALQQKEVEIPVPAPEVFVVAATEAAQPAARDLARELRAVDIAALLDIDGRNIKQQMKAADRSGSLFSLIIGDDEIKKGSVTVKVMETQEQFPVNRSEITQWLIDATQMEGDDE
ncbi:MAG: histidine--tRNA ligase [Armatimonadetes bacterium]|nr:histidine--tRNA ligase [Armatimonadota bacterium]